MREHATGSSADVSGFLTHEDAGVRERAWAWQSAFGMRAEEGCFPSAYLVETARRHIEGVVPMELVCRFVEIYERSHSDAAAAGGDRAIVELVRMFCGAAPAAVSEVTPAAAELPPAPESAAGLHIRHKRLLRALGTQTLGVPELLQALHLSTRQSFMRVWVTPAMEMGLVKALHPDAPRHPQQKYLLTRKGQRFLKQLIRK